MQLENLKTLKKLKISSKISFGKLKKLWYIQKDNDNINEKTGKDTNLIFYLRSDAR